jgi:hypothetical protein
LSSAAVAGQPNAPLSPISTLLTTTCWLLKTFRTTSLPNASDSARSAEHSQLSLCATFYAPITAPLRLNHHPLWHKDRSVRLDVLLVRQSSVLVSASRHCPSHSQPIVPPPLKCPQHILSYHNIMLLQVPLQSVFRSGHGLSSATPLGAWCSMS